jgi:hypothetical protein
MNPCFGLILASTFSSQLGVDSQASDMGSIPIARSINPVDAVGFTGFPPLKVLSNCPILDAVGREIGPGRSFGREEKARLVETRVPRVRLYPRLPREPYRDVVHGTAV